ncbi:monosaccharide ABC transporter ATP-binding protein, CUT2 family [Faunimonas pinastri]|uniref:Monosaccharide ABC transporter ATP-binding protein, CUT2 family n=1 Tax=Faunimonas pinastri TaxID=1855383 RepID=A0A1H9CKK9_9HYPH|nr:sugar ABC transporter ATP-binding protein [Faunimonas pinastri]SEQ01756.1 monosaccharide ABC transporter ATP-binding protein, CUT2 family [Faunimonas pinastri]
MQQQTEPRPVQTPLLEMRHISKTFPGVRALSNVDLAIYPGEIHSLMGENGAGKSTLMKVLSGAYQADPGGEILLEGKPIALNGPLSAKQHGIAVIYQELSLSPNLTVAENIYLGREKKTGFFVDRSGMIEGCRELLKRLGATFGPTTHVETLSIAERQLVEIARAIHADARILIMDEPTTALSARETDGLFELIRKLKADGLAIVYISHRMAEIYDLSDRVSVLRDGSYVGSLMRDELSADVLVKMMVGRDLAGFYTKSHDAHGSRGHVILSVRDFSDRTRVRGCGFDLHQGEVLGIAGLVGSGRTEFARLIFGADPKVSGTVELEGKRIDISSPREALDHGIVYLTEDRKAQGLFLDMSVESNVNLVVYGRDAKAGGILDLGKARARALEAIRSLSIRVANQNIEVGSLSGGNQQKVLLSRLMEIKPRVLILDEPTRGVDIGAKSEIYRVIDGLAKAGTGVVVISSELPEVIGICDRVLVMREGVIEGEVGGPDGAPVTQENIMTFATGLKPTGAEERRETVHG